MRTVRTALGALAACAALCALFAATASATSYQRPLKEAFGPVEQPGFISATAVGVNQATGDVVVADRGGDAKQKTPFWVSPMATTSL